MVQGGGAFALVGQDRGHDLEREDCPCGEEVRQVRGKLEGLPHGLLRRRLRLLSGFLIL